MTKRAQLADGTVLEFPDGTPDEIIDRTVQQHVAGSRPDPAYRRARQREERQAQGQQSYQNNPVGRALEFTNYWPDALGIGDELRGGSAFLGQGAENLVRRATGQPIDIPAETAYRAAADQRRDQYAEFQRRNPTQSNLATATGVIAGAGNPTAALPRIGMLQGGAAAAGINAPFALGRQEGTLEERLPGAAQESALAFGLGSLLTGGANMLARQAPNSGRIVSNMERLNIPPTAAAASNNPVTRSLTRLASENLLTGPRVRGQLTRSLEGTRDAAGQLSQRYGVAAGREGAGRVAQEGLERYARDAGVPNPNPPAADPLRVSTRDWSLAAKAREVFAHALRPIAGNPAAPTRTRAVLQSIHGRADPAVVAFREDPVLRQFSGVLDEVQQPTLNDLRELRRGIREAQDRPALDGQTVDNAALQRIEEALTQDIYAAAGPQHAAQLQRADEFYRRGRERIASALQAIAGRNATAGQSYNAIIRAASRQTPNTPALINLRRILRDDEWRTVAASIIDQMGTVPARRSGVGADINFSVEEFAAAYRNMTPQARRILFGQNARNGGRALMQDLDDLAEIASQQRAIEAMGTPSGRDVQNAVMGAGAVTNLPATGAAVLALGVSGEMLTNPGFVRWLTSAARQGARAGGARGSLAALAQIAARDPAIVPYFEAYRAQLAERQSASPAMRLEAPSPQ